MSKNSGLLELNAALALAARRNFRAAAVDLNMSPSALSHRIAQLEQRIGARLFHRTTRSVSLTQAGETFLARIDPALREIAHAIDDMNIFRNSPVGTLRINTSEGAARQIFAPVVLPYLKRHPGMAVDLVTDGRNIDIIAEGFDAGIRLLEAVPQEMTAVPIGPEQRMRVVASPRYLETREPPKTPADLASHRCIRRRMQSGSVYHWEFERDGKVEAIEPTGALTVGNDDLNLEAAVEGLGIAYMIDYAAAPHIAAGRLVAMLEDWTPPFPGLAIYYPAQKHIPAGLRAFIVCAREWKSQS